jgi:phosphatidylglycerophosphatase A
MRHLNKKQDYFYAFWATGFFTGYFRYAPGTFASLFAGIPLYFLLSNLPIYIYIVSILALTIIGIISANKIDTLYKSEDNLIIVIDEIVGINITYLLIPQKLYLIIIGFFLFRIFDIIKIPPANIVEKKMKNGFGVMLDDIICGIYANIILHVLNIVNKQFQLL